MFEAFVFFNSAHLLMFQLFQNFNAKNPRNPVIFTVKRLQLL